MKKLYWLVLTAVIFSGCYTTFYPPYDMSTTDTVPDSTKQVIINNYYETSSYYQVPYYRRYSLLWNDYYWDPFYYDYSYYHWRPYYWYGQYYYYNPRNHYWYYYNHHHSDWDHDWNGGSSGGSNSKGRIHKPGYNVLMSSPTGSAPFISVGSDNDQISKPVNKTGVTLNQGTSNNTGYYSAPRIESIGKKPVGQTSGNSSDSKSTYKPSSTGNKINKPTFNYSQPKQRSSSSSTMSNSGNSEKSKSSRTNSSSTKSSDRESSSSKKSK